MIRNFSDHAANERTFLAWVRTGIAVIAFGFVIERFNLFLETLAATLSEPGRRAWLARISGPLGRYDGLALIIVGIGVIVFAGIRFIRTSRLIDDPQLRPLTGTRAEMALSAIVALLAVGFSVYLVLG